jgi:hypothetical protein
MRPIEHRTDVNFSQALRCVQFRTPKQGTMKRQAYVHAIALRYGLIGAAACHHLLLSSGDEDEGVILDAMAGWPLIVEKHFRWESMDSLPFLSSPLLPTVLGNQAYQPLVGYLHGYKRLMPLEDCLRFACESYIYDNIEDIRSGWNWFQMLKPIREFRKVADESIHFALAFFERRQLDLEEVREIAILGE